MDQGLDPQGSSPIGDGPLGSSPFVGDSHLLFYCLMLTNIHEDYHKIKIID